MSEQSTETQLALLLAGQMALQREIEENKEESEREIAKANAKLAALEDERNKALKWGVATLGTAVMGMVMWIANKIIGGHIQ